MRVASDFELPELWPAEPGEPDLQVRLHPVEPLPGTHSWTASFDRGQFRFQDRSIGFRMHVADAGCVRCDAAPDTLDKGGRAHLLGQGLAAALWMRGVIPLHANVVTEGGVDAVAIAGPKGAGKSTLSLELIRRGRQLLCDDLCAVRLEDESARVYPGFPRLKLWPETLSLFGESVEGFRRLYEPLDKRHYPIRAEQFCIEPRRLRAVYLVAPGEGPLRMREINGAAKVQKLEENLMPIARAAMRRSPVQIITLVAALARSVTVYEIVRPAAGMTIQEVAALIGKS